MYEITVESAFCAAHAIVIAGEKEPLHGHNFRVTATIAGGTLDADGLLCDFHAVEQALREILAPFQNQNLNDTPPFDRVNPTAERIAEHIGTSLTRSLHTALSPRALVTSVRVTEAEGCAATYRPGQV